MIEACNNIVIGRTGSGKSYLVKKEVRRSERLIVYLTKAEDAEYAGVYFDNAAGEYRRFCAFWLWCAERHDRWRLVYRPRDIFDYEEFERLCRMVYAAGHCDFVCEEIGTYATERSIGPAFKTLLTAGRTRQIRTWLLTQRPFKIPREVTSQARQAFIFAMHEPADVRYVQDSFGQATAEAMGRLKTYEHIHWEETGKIEIGKA